MVLGALLFRKLFQDFSSSGTRSAQGPHKVIIGQLVPETNLVKIMSSARVLSSAQPGSPLLDRLGLGLGSAQPVSPRFASGSARLGSARLGHLRDFFTPGLENRDLIGHSHSK